MTPPCSVGLCHKFKFILWWMDVCVFWMVIHPPVHSLLSLPSLFIFGEVKLVKHCQQIYFRQTSLFSKHFIPTTSFRDGFRFLSDGYQCIFPLICNFITTLSVNSSSLLMTWPNHRSLFLLITWTIGSLLLCLYRSLFPFLSCRVTPWIILITFMSAVLICCSSLLVQRWLPKIRICLTMVWWMILGTFLSFSSLYIHPAFRLAGLPLMSLPYYVFWTEFWAPTDMYKMIL